MANETIEDAVIVIQEASAAIAQLSSKLNHLQSNNDNVVAALKDLTNKVSQLESNRASPSNTSSEVKVKPPLYIWVSFQFCYYLGYYMFCL